MKAKKMFTTLIREALDDAFVNGRTSVEEENLLHERISLQSKVIEELESRVKTAEEKNEWFRKTVDFLKTRENVLEEENISLRKARDNEHGHIFGNTSPIDLANFIIDLANSETVAEKAIVITRLFPKERMLSSVKALRGITGLTLIAAKEAIEKAFKEHDTAN